MSPGDEAGAPSPDAARALNPSMAIIIVVLIGACLAVAIFSMYLKKCMQGGDEGIRSLARRNQSIRFYDRPGEGLERAVIDSLPIVSFTVVKTLKHGKEYLECAVCLESFEDDEPLRLLPKCSHVFHTDCIDAWFLSHSTCPLCRTSLKAPAPVGEVSQRILEAQEELLVSSARMGSDAGTVIGEDELLDGGSGRDIGRESERDSARYTMLRKLNQNSNSFKRAARGAKIQERVTALSARYSSSTDHVQELAPQGCIHLSLQRTTSRDSTLDFYNNSLSYRSSLGRPGSLNEREMSRSSFGRLGSLNERDTPEEEGAEGVEPSPTTPVVSDTRVLLQKPQSEKIVGTWEQRVRRERTNLRRFSRSASEGRGHMFEMEGGITLAQRTMQWLSGENRSGPLQTRNDNLQQVVIQ